MDGDLAMRKVLVVIPAFNEEATIAAVVSEVRRQMPAASVLVVDDGSIDDTAGLAQTAGAAVARLPFNLGVGGAMRTGFRFALRGEYDAVVQVDADGQHDPACIPALIRALDSHDLVIGARFAGEGDYAVGIIRRAAMQVLATTMSVITRVRLDDSTSGFRAAGPKAIRIFAQHYPTEYLGDTLETLVIARRTGLSLAQIPVAMHPRGGGKPSRNAVGSTCDLLRAATVVTLGLVRDWSLSGEVLP